MNNSSQPSTTELSKDLVACVDRYVMKVWASRSTRNCRMTHSINDKMKAAKASLEKQILEYQQAKSEYEKNCDGIGMNRENLNNIITTLETKWKECISYREVMLSDFSNFVRLNCSLLHCFHIAGEKLFEKIVLGFMAFENLESQRTKGITFLEKLISNGSTLSADPDYLQIHAQFAPADNSCTLEPEDLKSFKKSLRLHLTSFKGILSDNGFENLPNLEKNKIYQNFFQNYPHYEFVI